MRESDKEAKNNLTINGMRTKALAILALTIIALSIIGAVHATGAANQLIPTSEKTIIAASRISPTNPNNVIMTISIDGQVWINKTLPKGNYTIQPPEDGTTMLLTIVPGSNVSPNIEEAVRLAQADLRVQSIIKNQPYEFIANTACNSPEATIITLHLFVGNAVNATANVTYGYAFTGNAKGNLITGIPYSITVDLTKSSVVSISNGMPTVNQTSNLC